MQADHIPSFLYYLPSSWSRFSKEQVAKAIHLLCLINTKLRSPTCQKSEIYLIMALGNIIFLTAEEVTTDGIGGSHLPWAVVVLCHFWAGQQATLEPSVGEQKDPENIWLPVCLGLNVWHAPPTPPTEGQAVRERLRSIQGLKRLPLRLLQFQTDLKLFFPSRKMLFNEWKEGRG